jgi:hypothetical protein
MMGTVTRIRKGKTSPASRNGKASTKVGPFQAKCEACGSPTGEQHVKNCPRAVVLNGKTGGVITVNAGDLDRVNAKLDRMAAAGKNRNRVAPPRATGDEVRAVQHAVDERKLLGFAQPLSKATLCGEYHIENGAEVGCSAFAILAIVDETKCDQCEKMSRKRELALCVAHAAKYVTGGPVDPQTRFSFAGTD